MGERQLFSSHKACSVQICFWLQTQALPEGLQHPSMWQVSSAVSLFHCPPLTPPLSLSLFLLSSFTVFLWSPPSYSHLVAEPFFSLSFYLSLSLSIYPLVSLSFYLSLSLSIYPLSLFISVALSPSLSFVPLSFHTPFLFPPLPLCLSFSIFLSVCLPLSLCFSIYPYITSIFCFFLVWMSVVLSGPVGN